MSNVYDSLEEAVAAKLRTDPWFWNQAVPADPPDVPVEIPASPNHVKTIQVDLEPTDIPVVEFTDLFPEDSLPALAVQTMIEQVTSRQETIGETRYEIPVKVLGVTLAFKRKEARKAAQELCANVERVLNGCRRSETALAIPGRGNFVKSVASTVDLRENKGARRHYGLLETDATVVVVLDD